MDGFKGPCCLATIQEKIVHDLIVYKHCRMSCVRPWMCKLLILGSISSTNHRFLRIAVLYFLHVQCMDCTPIQTFCGVPCTSMKATIGRLYYARIHVLSRVYIFRLTLIALIIYRLYDSYGCLCSFTLIRFVSGINSRCVMHDYASCIAAQTAPAVVKIDIDF